MNYLLIFVTILAATLSQIIIKYGQSTLYFPKSWALKEIFLMVIKNLFNPYVVSSIFVFLIGALAWVLVIQKIKLSVAYPFMSLSYVLIFLASYFLFRESINIYQVIGMLLLVTGFIFISLK